MQSWQHGQSRLWVFAWPMLPCCGLLRTVASMAGYIDAGDKEYVFTIIADEIPPGSTAQRAAKKTLDEMLGTFLKEIPQTP